VHKVFFLIISIFCLIPDLSYCLVKKGDKAPNFLIVDAENKTVNLYEFKEKVIIIEFLSTKCFACDYVIPDINRLYEKYNNSNVKIMGVLFRDEIDNADKLKEFKESRQIKYPLYVSDTNNKKHYNVYGFPNFFILNEKKEIVHIFRGITKDTFGLLNKEIEILLQGKK